MRISPWFFRPNSRRKSGIPSSAADGTLLGHVPRGEGDRVALAVQVAPEAADPVQGEREVEFEIFLEVSALLRREDRVDHLLDLRGLEDREVQPADLVVDTDRRDRPRGQVQVLPLPREEHREHRGEGVLHPDVSCRLLLGIELQRGIPVPVRLEECLGQLEMRSGQDDRLRGVPRLELHLGQGGKVRGVDHPDHQALPLEPDGEEATQADGFHLDQPLHRGGNFDLGEVDVLHPQLLGEGRQQLLLREERQPDEVLPQRPPELALAPQRLGQLLLLDHSGGDEDLADFQLLFGHAPPPGTGLRILIKSIAEDGGGQHQFHPPIDSSGGPASSRTEGRHGATAADAAPGTGAHPEDAETGQRIVELHRVLRTREAQGGGDLLRHPPVRRLPPREPESAPQPRHVGVEGNDRSRGDTALHNPRSTPSGPTDDPPQEQVVPLARRPAFRAREEEVALAPQVLPPSVAEARRGTAPGPSEGRGRPLPSPRCRAARAIRARGTPRGHSGGNGTPLRKR